MKCQYQLANHEQCDCNPVGKIWLPTWVTSNEGPRFMCQKHMEFFMDRGDVYLLNEDADLIFNQIGTYILRKDDPDRYENAIGMIKNHMILGRIGVTTHMVSIVDGKVWIGHTLYAMNMGDYSLVKEKCPALFHKGD